MSKTKMTLQEIQNEAESIGMFPWTVAVDGFKWMFENAEEGDIQSKAYALGRAWDNLQELYRNERAEDVNIRLLNQCRRIIDDLEWNDDAYELDRHEIALIILNKIYGQGDSDAQDQ